MDKTVVGRKGVSADHPLAVKAGVEALERGGNAFDAAIAASSVLSVVHPYSGGLGGDGFFLAFLGSGEVVAYNGSGRSPSGFDPEAYMGSKPLRGPLTVTVPGLVEMWGAISEDLGRMRLEDLLRPATALAEEGFYVGNALARAVERHRGELGAFQSWARVFGGLGKGDLFRNRPLARVLRAVAHRGWDEFYFGPTAEDLVEELSSQGVGISLEDLMDHEGLYLEPLRLDLGERVLYELPPNSQGLSTLHAISAIHELGLDRLGFDDPERIYAWSEPVARIYSFRDRNLGDPEKMTLDVRGLLRYASILDRAQPRSGGAMEARAADTTFLVACDGENIVGFIQSLFYPFGSGLVALGMPIQNRGRGFSFEKGLPNSPEPGKRPLHTLSILAVDSGESLAMIGCAGGDLRPQIHARIYENMFIYGMSPGEAVDAPRFLYTDLSGRAVLVEGRLRAPEPREGVSAVTGPLYASTGLVHAALVHKRRGSCELAPDPRGEGVAVAI